MSVLLLPEWSVCEGASQLPLDIKLYVVVWVLISKYNMWSIRLNVFLIFKIKILAQGWGILHPPSQSHARERQRALITWLPYIEMVLLIMHAFLIKWTEKLGSENDLLSGLELLWHLYNLTHFCVCRCTHTYIFVSK